MKGIVEYVEQSSTLSSLDKYIIEANSSAIKIQKDFAKLWYKNRNNEESGFPELAKFCKKIFVKKNDFDNIIYRPYEEHEKELRKYLNNGEDKKEFKEICTKCLWKVISQQDRMKIIDYYSLSNYDIDVFIQVVFFALRKIMDDKNVNLLSEK